MLDPTLVHKAYYCNPIYQHSHIMSLWLNFLKVASNMTSRKPCYSLISTYQKGMERIHQLENKVDEYSLRYPSLILQPGQLEIDEQVNAIWRFDSRYSSYVIKHFKPDFEIGDIRIWIVNTRWKVNFDLFYLTESYPDIHNCIMHMYHGFKNKRFVELTDLMNGSIYFPDDLVNRIRNEYGTDIFSIIEDIPYVYEPSINKNLYAAPYDLTPKIRLTSHSDGSNYLGDTELPTYRVNFTFEAWIETPSYMAIQYSPSYDIAVFDFYVGNEPVQNLNLEFFRFFPDNNLLAFLILGDFDQSFTIQVNRNIKIGPDTYIRIEDPIQVTIQLIDKETGIRTEYNDAIVQNMTDTYIEYAFSNVDSTKYNIEFLYNFKDI